jgi:hypothetical protein
MAARPHERTRREEYDPERSEGREVPVRDFGILLLLLIVAVLILGIFTDMLPSPVTNLVRGLVYGTVDAVQTIVRIMGLSSEYGLLMPRR